MSEHFYQIAVVGLKRENEDLFTSWAFDQGVEGVAEKMKFIQPDLVYDPTPVEEDVFDLEVYFTQPPPESFLIEMNRHFPEARCELTQQPHRDWLEEWKKGFEPFEFVRPFWIVPSWRPVPEGVTHPLHVDPGMAFGTGTHETTQLAGTQIVELLQAEQPQQEKQEPQEIFVNEPSINSLIDVGCGTGVLAIMAQQLGVSKVDAMDIDPECRRVSRENAERNHSSIRVLNELLPEIEGTYDVVVANIIDGVLTQLRGDLMRLTRPGGHLVLAGILKENEADFKTKFFAVSDHVILNRKEKGEWVSFLLKKN